MLNALKHNWQKYLIEAWCLGTFMVSASVFGVALFHLDSPVAGFGFGARNLAMGTAMGATAIGIIRSPWGQRSGAHFNPSVTLAFLRLGEIDARNAFFYILSQFAGGAAGVFVSWLLLGDWLSDATVNFLVTVPGPGGPAIALAAEALISFLMMITILWARAWRSISSLTPYFAGTLLCVFITFESHLSGTSLNPARTIASAVFAGNWSGWWLYFVGPPLGMLVAAEFFMRMTGLRAVISRRLNFSGRFRTVTTTDNTIEVTKNPARFPTIAGLF